MKLKELQLMAGRKIRRALVMCLSISVLTAGCAVYKVQEQDRLAFGRATAAVGEVTGTVDSAKVSAAAQGEAQAVLQSILRSQANVSGYLDRGKIQDRELQKFRESLTLYHELVPEFVNTAVADKKNYSINRDQRERLSAQAVHVRAALTEIFARLDAYDAVNLEKLTARIRTTVQALGMMLNSLDETALKNADATKRAKLSTDIDKWLQGINTGLKNITDRVEGKPFDADGLVNIVNANFSGSNPFRDFGLRMSVNTVNGYLPQGNLSDRTKRILGVIQTEFDKIATDYRMKHHLAAQPAPAI